MRERLREDPHVWASVLYDEVVALGFALSYPSLVASEPQTAEPPALRFDRGDVTAV